MDSTTPETSLAERLRDEWRQQASARGLRRMRRSQEKAQHQKRRHLCGCSQGKDVMLLGLVHGHSRLATAQGLYLLLTGVWPLAHYRSFEWISGPKKDDWLIKCVGGLAATMGYVQLRSGRSDQGRATARRIGIGAAATFGAIDAIYGGGGRISRIYLLDAAVEAGWLTAWLKTGTARKKDGVQTSHQKLE